MNKLFLAICFSIFAFNAKAATVEIKDVNTVRPQEQVTDSSVFLPDNMPDPDDTEEVIAFFKERFKNASVSHANELGDLNQSDSIDVQHSSEYIAQIQEQRKSTFEKFTMRQWDVSVATAPLMTRTRQPLFMSLRPKSKRE